MKVTSTDLQTFKAGFFRALAHPARIGILEVLVCGERTVSDIQHELGFGQSVVSQQLSVLRDKNIVSSRKHGTTVYYGVRDPLLSNLLKLARRICDKHLVGTQRLLRELQRERRER
jgi:DNA-binding transcriptional ArsR family regulator